MRFDIAVLPGDGIGQEVTPQGVKVLQAVGQRFGHQFDLHHALVGAAALEAGLPPLPEETLELSRKSHAVFFGSVGDPRFDHLEMEKRPERGLVNLRKQLGLQLNLRPCRVFPALQNASTIKPAVLRGVDVVVVRELSSRLFSGKPKKQWQARRGRRAIDPLVCYEEEVSPVLKASFELARTRRRRLTLVGQFQVLATSTLWREIAREMAAQYPDVELQTMAPDNCLMQLMRNPVEFDVVLADNVMVAGMLSDEAAMLMGSVGMAPSAEMRLPKDGLAGVFGLYEPVHGSAPRRAGQNMANPIAAVLSVAAMLRYTLMLNEEADVVEAAVGRVLEQGFRTYDIMETNKTRVGTSEMGDLIAQEVLSFS